MIDAHDQSKIGKARANLAALRAHIQPLEQTLKEHKAERSQRQALIDSATLDTPPIEMATAESRIRLLDRALTRETAELEPLLRQLQTAELDLRDLESAAESKLEWLPELQDVLGTDVQFIALGRWLSELRDARMALLELTEAPLPPGARYEPVVSVAFQLLEAGQELPARGPSPRELKRLAWEEQKRRVDQEVRAHLDQRQAERREMVAQVNGSST